MSREVNCAAKSSRNLVGKTKQGMMTLILKTVMK
jgi:hypothetical protein